MQCMSMWRMKGALLLLVQPIRRSLNLELQASCAKYNQPIWCFQIKSATTILWVETPAAVSRARCAAELQKAFQGFSLLESGSTLMCCSWKHFCEQNKCVWATSRWVQWVIKCNLTSLLEHQSLVATGLSLERWLSGLRLSPTSKIMQVRLLPHFLKQTAPALICLWGTHIYTCVWTCVKQRKQKQMEEAISKHQAILTAT